jgi:hypothetical protein
MYVVVFADKSEYFQTISPQMPTRNQAICEDAVRAKRLTTTRKNPQKVMVELFTVEANGGELRRHKVGDYEVMPCLEPMNHEEYEEELTKAIEDLPPEFREYARQTSWERGHSAGYEEVVSIASGVTYDLLPHIQQYHNRIVRTEQKSSSAAGRRAPTTKPPSCE